MAVQRRRLCTFQERKNVLELYDDRELIKRYRFDHQGILFVTDLVRNSLTPQTLRNNALTAELKVIMTLRFLATGKMQQCTSDDLGPSQSTVSRVLNGTIAALTTPNIVRQFIDFPTDLQTLRQKQEAFMRIAGFPGVVGAIDGTHVHIISPTVNEEAYVNRKGFHSINVQVVFDAAYKILDLVPKWPGSTHDSRVLSESGLTGLFEQNYVRPGCHLVGDSGYPLKRCLFTPYRRPQGEQQLNYNCTGLNFRQYLTWYFASGNI